MKYYDYVNFGELEKVGNGWYTDSEYFFTSDIINIGFEIDIDSDYFKISFSPKYTDDEDEIYDICDEYGFQLGKAIKIIDGHAFWGFDEKKASGTEKKCVNGYIDFAMQRLESISFEISKHIDNFFEKNKISNDNLADMLSRLDNELTALIEQKLLKKYPYLDFYDFEKEFFKVYNEKKEIVYLDFSARLSDELKENFEYLKNPSNLTEFKELVSWLNDNIDEIKKALTDETQFCSFKLDDLQIQNFLQENFEFMNSDQLQQFYAMKNEKEMNKPKNKQR